MKFRADQVITDPIPGFKELVLKLGFKKTIMDVLFACAYDYLHHRGSVSLADILIYLPDGVRVKPEEVWKMQIQHKGSWKEGTTYRWITKISGEKIQVYTHNQLLFDQIYTEQGDRLCFADGTLIKNQQILETYRGRGSLENLEHYVTINRKETRVYTYREIENDRFNKAIYEEVKNSEYKTYSQDSDVIMAELANDNNHPTSIRSDDLAFSFKSDDPPENTEMINALNNVSWWSK